MSDEVFGIHVTNIKYGSDNRTVGTGNGNGSDCEDGVGIAMATAIDATANIKLLFALKCYLHKICMCFAKTKSGKRMYG